MEFNCQTVPVERLLVDHNGVKQPLCNSCLQTECSNPIKTQTISIMGVPQKWRVWALNNAVRQVIQCVGYINEQLDDTIFNSERPDREHEATDGSVGSPVD